MSTPFKMKGNPMQRNFGIGASPMKQDVKKKEEVKKKFKSSDIFYTKPSSTEKGGKSRPYTYEKDTKSGKYGYKFTDSGEFIAEEDIE